MPQGDTMRGRGVPQCARQGVGALHRGLLCRAGEGIPHRVLQGAWWLGGSSQLQDLSGSAPPETTTHVEEYKLCLAHEVEEGVPNGGLQVCDPRPFWDKCEVYGDVVCCCVMVLLLCDGVAAV